VPNWQRIVLGGEFCNSLPFCNFQHQYQSEINEHSRQISRLSKGTACFSVRKVGVAICVCVCTVDTNKMTLHYTTLHYATLH